MKNPLGTKLYYSISEVAEMTDLQPYTLRAWEKEFSCLRPKRARGKNRAYRDRDIGIILLIKRLLYEERYTTQGVKQKLRNEPELLRRAADQAAGLRRTVSHGKDTEAGSPGSQDPSSGGIASGEEIPADERARLKEWIRGTKEELEEILRLL